VCGLPGLVLNGGVHILPLVEPFAQRADLHCMPGLTSALASGAERNTSALDDGEAGARGRLASRIHGGPVNTSPGGLRDVMNIISG